MKLAIVSWLKGKPVPPQGYGGIERMVATMTREFIRQGHEVTLIAPPDSFIEGADHFLTNDFWDALRFINDSDFDFVWDNSCWNTSSPVRQSINTPFMSTTHVNDAINWSKNVIYLSYSQRKKHARQVGKKLTNPIIPVPTDPQLQPRGLDREDYLLFLGAVVPWKGVLEAAQLAQRLHRPLLVAGPAAGEYADEVAKYPNVTFLGVVDGQYKSDLLEQAWAVCCLHNDGNMGWSEPGCGVLMEANVFNTPVIAFPNGCLQEMVLTGINGWCGETLNDVERLIRTVEVPENSAIFANTIWRVDNVVHNYLMEFNKILNGWSYD